MREQSTIPRKSRTLIAVVIASAPWPAWSPKPAIAETPHETTRQSRRRRSETDSEAALQERVALVKIVGHRLREARDMAGMSQQVAAKELGYSNSSKLAKVENAADTNSVPFWLIAKAAQVYEVSSDYLLGISEDWDVSPSERHQRQIGRWLLDTWQAARERDLVALADVTQKMTFLADAVGALTERADNSQLAFDKFRNANPCYDDLIGGAKLLARLEALGDAGRQARLQLRRLHLDLSGQGTGFAEANNG